MVDAVHFDAAIQNPSSTRQLYPKTQDNVKGDLSFSEGQSCVQTGGGLTEEGIFKAPKKGVYRFSFSATTCHFDTSFTRVEVLRHNHETKMDDIVFWISECTRHEGKEGAEDMKVCMYFLTAKPKPRSGYYRSGF